MDILTYIVQGQGRHADSLGNRCTFDSPGMQWIRWRETKRSLLPV
jgi:redox-sensitive bicupin YhaK (pirin superfamily)